MRVYLIGILCFVFLPACKEETSRRDDSALPLHPHPLIVPLDLKDGFKKNQITGDAIRPLVTISGDTIKTGVATPWINTMNGKKIIRPVKIDNISAVKTIISGNVHPVPDTLSITAIDTTKLTRIRLGEGDQTYVVKNSYGIVKTGVPIAVTGKKVAVSEPPSVKAAPMRFKDNAVANIQYLDVEQGLSYSYVYAVCEDKNGYLWFGIDGTGITKYDGINLTTYTVKEGLTHNIVTSIIEDRKGNLWIGTYGGVSRFDGKSFIQYTEKDGLPNNEVLSIYEDKDGNLWFCTISGITKFDGKNIVNYSIKEGMPEGAARMCTEDSKGNLWIACSGGVVKSDGRYLTHFTAKDGLPASYVSWITEDNNENIWMGLLGEGLVKYDGRSFTRFTKKEGLSENNIWSVIKDRNGNLWIGTYEGLNHFDGKKFTHYNIEQGLSNVKVRGIIEDKNGNIWIGTDGGGVNKLNPGGFSYLVDDAVIDNFRIRPILKTKDGSLWFGTENGGVGKLSSADNKSGEKVFTYFKAHDKLSSGQRSLLQDKEGQIWIGTTGKGIAKYDGKNFFTYQVADDEKGLAIFDMLQDQNDHLWLASRDGSVLKYRKDTFTVYKPLDSLADSFVYTIFKDTKENTWFTTEGAGVIKYDGINFIRYTEKEGLFSKSITSITEDDNGNIWFGTLGSGICRFDGLNFTYYTTQQGIADNNVWSAYRDRFGQLWFGTDKGLSLLAEQNDSNINSTGYRFYNFTSQDGLKAIDLNLHSACTDDDGRIWWGTGKGFLSLDVNKKYSPGNIRSLSISGIGINEQFHDFRNLNEKEKRKISFHAVRPFSNYPDQPVFSHDRNHLTFHFAAIDWSAPDKIKYSYRLSGSENAWSIPSHQVIADYRNLPHGDYELQVKAIGQSQVWTDPVSYHFFILPPWWLTWWFKTVILLISLSVLYFIIRFIYRYHLRKQRMLLEKKLAVQYERQRISSEMHDDIGASLSGIRLMTQLAKKKVNDPQSVSEIEKIHQSVDDITAKMKEVIWSLNTDNDSLPNLLYYLQKQSRAMMEHYPGIFTMTIPETIPDIKISGDTRRDVHLVVKEALHNIIKHSGADKASVDISVDDKLRIIISDNGKGLNGAQTMNSGDGMKNMQHRTQQLGGNLVIENKQGLTLRFNLPLN